MTSKITPEEASHIQSTQAQAGRDVGPDSFTARTQSAAALNERERENEGAIQRQQGQQGQLGLPGQTGQTGQTGLHLSAEEH